MFLWFYKSSFSQEIPRIIQLEKELIEIGFFDSLLSNKNSVCFLWRKENVVGYYRHHHFIGEVYTERIEKSPFNVSHFESSEINVKTLISDDIYKILPFVNDLFEKHSILFFVWVSNDSWQLYDIGLLPGVVVNTVKLKLEAGEITPRYLNYKATFIEIR